MDDVERHEGGAMSDQHPHHGGHRHVDAHRSIRFASAAERRRLTRPVYRIDRRRFITELGRNTFAVAILGGIVAACSDETGDSSVPRPPDSLPETTPPESADSAPPATTPQTDPAEPTTSPDTARDDPAGDESALRWSQVDLGFVSAYVLVRGSRGLVVDTGGPGSVLQIGDTLERLGLTFDDVDHVVLTHHHPDHIGSLPEVVERAPAAALYAGAADIPNIETAAAITAVGDGDDVFGLQVIETPGHTPGSISVLDTGIGLLVAGDALNGNGDGTAITGPNEQFTADMVAAEASVAKLAGFDFGIAAFGHGQPVTAGAGELVDALVSG